MLDELEGGTSSILWLILQNYEKVSTLQMLILIGPSCTPVHNTIQKVQCYLPLKKRNLIFVRPPPLKIKTNQ